jgi:hypothetical protein
MSTRHASCKTAYSIERKIKVTEIIVTHLIDHRIETEFLESELLWETRVFRPGSELIFEPIKHNSQSNALNEHANQISIWASHEDQGALDEIDF